MTLDKEEHRAILTQLMNKSHFPGEFSEEVTVLKRAIASATIAEDADDSATPLRLHKHE